MPKTVEAFRQFSKGSLFDDYGYKHPALQDAFNTLARLPYGREIFEYSRKAHYPVTLIPANQMPAHSVAVCTTEQIFLTTAVTYDVAAHEMRHVYHIRELGAFQPLTINPVYIFLQQRMVEADALTIQTLVRMMRWKELEWDGNGTPPDHPDINVVEASAYKLYNQIVDEDRDVLPILRFVFDSYYAYNARNLKPNAYEDTAMKRAGGAYFILHNLLQPRAEKTHMVATAFFAVTLGATLMASPLIGMAGLCALGICWASEHKREQTVQGLIKSYNDIAEPINELAKKLGKVPGINGNYLTDTHGEQLGSAKYTAMMTPEAKNLHAEWHKRIEKSIADYRRPYRLL